MGGCLIRWLITVIAVLVAAFLLPGWVSYSSLLGVAIFAIVLAVLNAIVRPILIILTLPINILTLGLFILVVNAIVFWLATVFAPGVMVRGFVGAFLGALVVSIVSFIVNRIIQ